jgi:hypothetical protein
MRKRQSYLTRSLTSGDELNAIRREINDSLTFVARDPLGMDPILLEHEAQRLTDIHEPPVRHRSPTRRTISPSIALRSMRAAAAVAASSSPSQLGSQSPSSRIRSSRPRY